MISSGIKSLIWLGVALKCIKSGKVYKRSGMAEAFMCATAMIVCRMIAGIIIGTMGKSPYDHSFTGIILNMWYMVPVIIGQESLRSAILNRTRRKNRIWAALLITVAYTMMSLNISAIKSIGSIEEATIYLVRYPATEITKNILLNNLVIFGGAGTSILYSVMTGMFEWMFPVLPVLNWLTDAVCGIVLMSVLCIMINGAIVRRENRNNKCTYKKENVAVPAVVLTLGVAFVWFVEGVFGVFPSVVLTGSMKPEINPGDIVIVRKIHSEEEMDRLKDGDVITFSRDDIIITHRIIEVIEDEYGNISYRTKGDNNSAEDVRLVKQSEVRGVNVCTVPYAGLPVLWIKGSITKIPEGVVN